MRVIVGSFAIPEARTANDGGCRNKHCRTRVAAPLAGECPYPMPSRVTRKRRKITTPSKRRAAWIKRSRVKNSTPPKPYTPDLVSRGKPSEGHARAKRVRAGE